MKTVNGWQMEGHRPPTPEWDGTGKHPILGMTMEEIKAHAQASVDRFIARADSDTKSKRMSAEEEAQHMQIRASEMQETALKNLAASLSTIQPQS